MEKYNKKNFDSKQDNEPLFVDFSSNGKKIPGLFSSKQKPLPSIFSFNKTNKPLFVGFTSNGKKIPGLFSSKQEPLPSIFDEINGSNRTRPRQEGGGNAPRINDL